MKVAASIFTWIGVILGIITNAVVAFGDTSNILIDAGFTTEFVNSYMHIFKTTALVLFIVFLVVDIGIALWREISVRNGKHVLVGIFTLICVSFLGGLFTLLIKEDRSQEV
ncbi:MAG: hypothetical protein SOV26_02020 [Candidatus Onthovivens sp.]|nr:hypothetical protein [Candidatus Onthovivens sp.]